MPVPLLLRRPAPEPYFHPLFFIFLQFSLSREVIKIYSPSPFKRGGGANYVVLYCLSIPTNFKFAWPRSIYYTFIFSFLYGISIFIFVLYPRTNKDEINIQINHDTLLTKFARYGKPWLANTWLNSFLKNRTQYVYLDGHRYITKEVTCGILQGSTLGPLLFLV